MTDLRHRLRAARTAKGLTLEQAAELFGVHKMTVWRWEAGKRPIGGAAKVVTFDRCRCAVSYASTVSGGAGRHVYHQSYGQAEGRARLAVAEAGARYRG